MNKWKADALTIAKTNSRTMGLRAVTRKNALLSRWAWHYVDPGKW